MRRNVLLVLGLVASAYILAAANWFGHSLGLWPQWLIGHNVPVPDWTEAVGAVTGAWGVYLVVIENIWNWPIGNLNSAFYVWVFMQSRLFMDASLSLIYVILGFYGWYWWLNGGAKKDDLPITHTPRFQWPFLMAILVVATLVLWRISIVINGAAPFLDSLLTVGSLIAQYMITRKYIENWLFWIGVDIIYVPLYFSRSLNLTGVLYILFLALAVSGYLNWRKLMASQAVPEVPNPLNYLTRDSGVE